jgi:hypothetical protein
MRENEFEKILAEAPLAWPNASWTSEPPPQPNPHDAKMFKGVWDTVGPDGGKVRWVFVAVSFEIESQGFPPGTRGFDGTLAKNHVIIHIERDMAEKIFAHATKAVGA